MLIVFAGLPGTGKSTLARMLACDRRATYLRIDIIEQALRGSGSLAAEVGPAGYIVAYAVAEANLGLGQDVVADSVNPLDVTRRSWRGVAERASSGVVDIEVICSDATEHRRRVETRIVDISGLVPPTWEQVRAREYDSWDSPRIVVDTAGRTIAESFAELRAAIAAR